ncbi:formyl transferase [Amylocarpus encephaloides]|uniref:methionyl-tRNA formyltransferase n=1 Tax=Amylocarpus encephaloides TaxID=45428 RepID=A0A9P8C867_9HELO|nr:formyl transferase [Amylocarpus encephaloides]
MKRTFSTIPSLATRSVSQQAAHCFRRGYGSKTSKPLRVLFCGSDELSCESLRAVHAEHERNPDLIASIDVLIRRAKKVGRGLKRERDVPIKAVAGELELPIHEIGHFIPDWKLRRPNDEKISLIIAVSFGLFIPAQVLQDTEYGGINIHPSLIPDYRGAAPLHHVLMNGEPSTGITLQTLDHHSFDRGTILAQTAPPGLIPIPPLCTYDQLLDMIKPRAAEMLISGLRKRLFVPPFTDFGLYKPKEVRLASKITSEHRQIDWANWDTNKIVRHSKALGRLWSQCYVEGRGKATAYRTIFEDMAIFKPAIETDTWVGMVGMFEDTYIKNALTNSGYLQIAQPFHYGYWSTFLLADGTKRKEMWFQHGEGIIICRREGQKLQYLLVNKVTVEGKEPSGAYRAMCSVNKIVEPEKSLEGAADKSWPGGSITIDAPKARR